MKNKNIYLSLSIILSKIGPEAIRLNTSIKVHKLDPTIKKIRDEAMLVAYPVKTSYTLKITAVCTYYENCLLKPSYLCNFNPKVILF